MRRLNRMDMLLNRRTYGITDLYGINDVYEEISRVEINTTGYQPFHRLDKITNNHMNFYIKGFKPKGRK